MSKIWPWRLNQVAKPAQPVMMLQQQDLVAGLGQVVGGGQAAQTGADHHHVVGVCRPCRWSDMTMSCRFFREYMLIDHGHPGKHGPDDTQIALIGAGHEEIVQRGTPVAELDRAAVDGAVALPVKRSTVTGVKTS